MKVIKLLCLMLIFCNSIVLTTNKRKKEHSIAIDYKYTERIKLNNNKLIEAVRSQDISKVKELLNHGVNVNSKDQDGNTPLIFAAELSSNIALVKVLLDYGADVSIKNKSNKDAIDSVKGRNYFVISSWGADEEDRKQIERTRSSAEYIQNLLILEKELVQNLPIRSRDCYNIHSHFGHFKFGNILQLEFSDLIWFFSRISENKKNLIYPEYLPLVDCYSNLIKGETKKVIKFIKFVKSDLLVYLLYRADFHSIDRIIKFYQDFADVVYKILYLNRVGISINENIIEDEKEVKKINKKISKSQNVVLPWDITNKIALEY